MEDEISREPQTCRRSPRQRGGQCLSERYITVMQKLRWRCAQGHTWEAIGASVKRGCWCPQCKRDGMFGTIEEMQAVAVAKGGKCLSATYIDSKTRLDWQCAAGHTWQATPAAIKTYWCRERGIDRTRLGIDKMQEWAAKHGGRCLSTTYKNKITPLTWQCIAGHIWEARPENIQADHWCPVCNQIKLAENRRIKKQVVRTKVPILL